MDCAAAVFGSIFQCWDCTTKYRTYIQNLGDNLNSLENKMNELSHVKVDVTRRVETAEGKGWVLTSDVDGWLERVDALKVEVSGILAKGKQLMEKSCLCSLYPKNCRARYRQSKAAERKESTVETEIGRGRSFEVVAYEPGDLVLKRSLEALWDKMAELGHVFEDVRERVKMEEDRHLKRTSEVGGWLERVELLKEEVGKILEKGKQQMEKSNQGVGGDLQSHRNCPSYHQLSKHAEEKRATLEEELGKARGFTVYTYKPDDPLMVEIPLESPVGLDSTFEEVWNWVQDERVRQIGLYGMGGVGKTTLLRKIHNEFLKIEHDYNVVAWIVVSRSTNLEKIQDAIWKKLKLSEAEWHHLSEQDRAGKILSIMKKKSFMLFLDDIWEEIDLLNIGIPSRGHQHRSKIIFTTRSEEVCGLMQADRTKKVGCLSPHKALELFREKVGEETWSAHVEIPKLAEALVEECEYLPLALITVGSSMASRKHLEDWRRTIKVLKNRPSNFAGMEKGVLSVLEFSYEALPNETQKKCFLYCSIFPEDHEYDMEQLINLWIGEGFLDECDGIHEASDCGIDIINNLTRVCLLEDHCRRKFRMHDVVRDMALWVSSEHGQKKNKIIVQEKQKSFLPKEVKKWNDAEKISLWRVDQNTENIDAALTTCSSLSTLILRHTEVETFPHGFFSSMPALRVLDLSGNGCLIELTEDIGVLGNLRYLNLEGTKIMKLPMEVKRLTKLVVLLVDRACIPEGLIPSLSSLRLFHWGSNHSNSRRIVEGDELNLIEELNGMNEIDEIYLTLTFDSTVKKLFMSCPVLQSCLSVLRLTELGSLTIPKSSPRRMEHLTYISFYHCRFAEITMEDVEYGDRSSLPYGSTIPKPPLRLESQDWFRSLERISISHCQQLQDVTVLIYNAPYLKYLKIESCYSMRELIGSNVAASHVYRIFLCLINLCLINLPKLERICSRLLAFPLLERVEVNGCPKLKKLPLVRSKEKVQ
ncbi:disease resistance protein RFL1-like [Punica granatum]|uniref:Disease resistance protein RFL1-like n=1 Tax=Punica granatum TaxID=22663 RepID=A0A6P8BPC0_PUNGR|nr:disease resistance protein RFL1-like [Punica granatum]